MSAEMITLQAGTRQFLATPLSVSKSRILGAMLASHVISNAPIFVDTDPEVFAHVLSYMTSEVFPLLYDRYQGHDYYMYARIQREAKLHGLYELENYFESKRYLEAIKVNREVQQIEGVSSHATPLSRSNETVSYHPQWVVKKSYVCPRGLQVHMGDKRACGKECRKAQGDDPDRYEEMSEMQLLKVKEEVKFYPEVLLPES